MTDRVYGSKPMQLLRIAHKSNGAIAVIALILSAIITVASGLFAVAIWNTDLIPAIGGGVLFILGAGTSIYLLRGIVSPYEHEFVMEPEGFRFGRTDKPGQQRKIARANIKSLVLDLGPDHSLCISTGRWLAPHLAPGIIGTRSQMAAVAEAVGKHWPEIPVRDRETFQRHCSSRDP